MKNYMISTIYALALITPALADTASLSSLPKYQCQLIHTSAPEENTNVFQAENAGAAVLQYINLYLVPTDIGYVMKDQAETFNSADPKQESTVIVDLVCTQVK